MSDFYKARLSALYTPTPRSFGGESPRHSGINSLDAAEAGQAAIQDLRQRHRLIMRRAGASEARSRGVATSACLMCEDGHTRPSTNPAP